MQFQVLIERVAGNGYRAKMGEPFAFTTDGATRDEALGKLRRLIDDKLRAGAELVSLDVAANDNPWLRLAGTLDPNDPDVKEWIQIMEENRRKDDEDPDIL